MCRLREKYLGISTRLFGLTVIAALIGSVQGCVSVPKAAYEGKLSRVTGYLASGKGTVHDKFDEGKCPSCTLIHYAAAGGKVEVAKALVESGADVNVANGAGLTPLHLAAESRRGAMARFLLANGAKPSLSIRDRHGNTPLLYAVAGGQESEPKAMVLATGTVVYTAEKTQSAEELAEILLAAGADPNTPTNLGNTPLHIAAYRGRVRACKLLLESGADLTRRNNDGETAEMLAERFGNREVVSLLRQPATR